MNRFRLLEHTADIGIAAAGEDLAALFQQSAFGLRQVITEAAVRPQLQKKVAIVAEDVEELLVNWLSELLYLFESELFLPATVRVEKIDDRSLQAKVCGEIIDPEKTELEREIKAITYHQIRVTETYSGWQAQVFVDI